MWGGGDITVGQAEARVDFSACAKRSLLGRGVWCSWSLETILESAKKKEVQSPAAGNQMPEASPWAQSLNWGLEAELHPYTALVTSLKAGKFTVQV